MSRVSIQGNDAGTGTFTVAAPNSNNNRTFNLPDEAGTALTDASDLEPQVKTSLNATGDAPLFACRAFCNFDGTGTISIRDSGNVSSISDNGQGYYTINFTTAMPDANYAATSGIQKDGGVNDGNLYAQVGGYGAIPQTASATFVRTTRISSVNPKDSQAIFVAIFR